MKNPNKSKQEKEVIQKQKRNKFQHLQFFFSVKQISAIIAAKHSSSTYVAVTY
jgi:hypothetical protein